MPKLTSESSIGLDSFEGQALGYGGEFAATANVALTEAAFEHPADGGDKRGTAGEENHVDGGRFHICRFEECIHAVRDGVDFGCDPLLK